ncbi:MAG: hypothetical protein KOO60_07980 [Gemmatimonadales bacterium]|nr:hypothetical protein [Gemmatimonadales bacterium]
MKKLVVLILASLMVASVASAVVDPDVNSMGIYFDVNADVFEMPAGPYVEIPAYVILANPDVSGVWGYEFGFTAVGNYIAPSIELNGTGPIDVGGGLGNHIVGLAAPIATTQATILATIKLLPMDVAPIYYTLTGADPNSMFESNTPNIVAPPGDVLVGCGVSAWDVELEEPGICAMVNDTGVIATDEASWDSVKSLYR